jgi:TonB-linked SusC/RagA family outer membrane protein
MRFFLPNHSTTARRESTTTLLLYNLAYREKASVAFAALKDAAQANFRVAFQRGLMLLVFVLMSASVFAQNTIQGTVTDEKGVTLPGVTVRVKGGTAAVASDVNGKFTINASSGQTLVFSMVGFESREVVVGTQTNISIGMSATSSSLNEVVVVGYGTQKRASLTSSVSTISGAEITTTKNENIVNSLAGKVPGLRVVQNTSEPGAFNTSFDIRGMGTPLIVIDGIPRPDIARIDPNDVESLSVMKDASAAVYGARAANGVILITTKKGKKGAVEINYSGFYGFQVPAGFPTSSNATEYMTLANELNKHSVNAGLGGNRIYTDADFEAYANGTRVSTDWQAATIKRQSNETQHSLSASGGTDNSNYFFSLGYTGQDSYLKSDDLYYKKYNFRSNVSTKVSKNLTFDLNLSGIMERKDQPMQAAYWVFRSMWYQPPIATNSVYA